MIPMDPDTPAPEQFTDLASRWIEADDDAPPIARADVIDGTPAIVYLAPSGDREIVLETVWSLVTACFSAFEATEYAVDRVILVALYADAGEITDDVTWQLEGRWARDYLEADLSIDDVGERVWAVAD